MFILVSSFSRLFICLSMLTAVPQLRYTHFSAVLYFFMWISFSSLLYHFSIRMSILVFYTHYLSELRFFAPLFCPFFGDSLQKGSISFRHFFAPKNEKKPEISSFFFVSSILYDHDGVGDGIRTHGLRDHNPTL